MTAYTITWYWNPQPKEIWRFQITTAIHQLLTFEFLPHLSTPSLSTRILDAFPLGKRHVLGMEACCRSSEARPKRQQTNNKNQQLTLATLKGIVKIAQWLKLCETCLSIQHSRLHFIGKKNISDFCIFVSCDFLSAFHSPAKIPGASPCGPSFESRRSQWMPWRPDAPTVLLESKDLSYNQKNWNKTGVLGGQTCSFFWGQNN